MRAETPRPASSTPGRGRQVDPRFSPDGRFLIYQSDESGRPEIYVKPFPNGDGKWRVSLNRGVPPRWSSRGDRVFLLAGNPLKVKLEVHGAQAIGLAGVDVVTKKRQPRGAPGMSLGFVLTYVLRQQRGLIRLVICGS
jgi:hypothetical protein